MFIRAFRTAFYLVCFAVGAAFAGSASASDATLHQTLQGKLDQAYGPIWVTGDAAKFVSEFLTDDVVITASDSPTVWAGNAQSTKLIAELIAAYPHITATAVWTAPLGSEAAYQFVVFQLMPADEKEAPVTAKSLYVWVKTANGWRVAADHYSYVGMDTPAIDAK